MATKCFQFSLISAVQLWRRTRSLAFSFSSKSQLKGGWSGPLTRCKTAHSQGDFNKSCDFAILLRRRPMKLTAKQLSLLLHRWRNDRYFVQRYWLFKIELLFVGAEKRINGPWGAPQLGGERNSRYLTFSRTLDYKFVWHKWNILHSSDVSPLRKWIMNKSEWRNRSDMTSVTEVNVDR